jgi:hypothetical protein
MRSTPPRIIEADFSAAASGTETFAGFQRKLLAAT